MPPVYFLLHLLAVVVCVFSLPDEARPPVSPGAKRVLDYWTPQRLRNAKPLNIMIGGNGAVRNLRSQQSSSNDHLRRLQQEVLGVVTNDEYVPNDIIKNSTGTFYMTFASGDGRCSATVIDNNAGDTTHTYLITAAHCVNDHPEFGSNFLFVPNRDEGDQNGIACNDDAVKTGGYPLSPYGCWAVEEVFIDKQFSLEPFFNDNAVRVDYAIVKIPNTSYRYPGLNDDPNGDSSNLDNLQTTVTGLKVDFVGSYNTGVWTQAIGYPASDGFDLRYCANNYTEGGSSSDPCKGPFSFASGTKVVPLCGMEGGSSGGPWVINNTATNEPTIISVNSYGTRGCDGMGGPPLSTTAKCVFESATGVGCTDVNVNVASKLDAGAGIPDTTSSPSPSAAPSDAPVDGPGSGPSPVSPACGEYTVPKDCNSASGCSWNGQAKQCS